MISGPAASTSPGNLLAMHITGLCPRPTESEMGVAGIEVKGYEQTGEGD